MYLTGRLVLCFSLAAERRHAIAPGETVFGTHAIISPGISAGVHGEMTHERSPFTGLLAESSHSDSEKPRKRGSDAPAHHVNPVLKHGANIRDTIVVNTTPQQGEIDERLKRKLIHGYYASTSFVDLRFGLVSDRQTVPLPMDCGGLTLVSTQAVESHSDVSAVLEGAAWLIDPDGKELKCVSKCRGWSFPPRQSIET